MKTTTESKWLCENAKDLEQYSGQWVVFTAMHGMVGRGASLAQVLKDGHPNCSTSGSFVFHIPSKAELVPPSLSVPVRQVSR